jgi:hypothetical protein
VESRARRGNVPDPHPPSITADSDFRAFLREQANAIIEGRGMPARWHAKRHAMAAKRAAKARRKKLPKGIPLNRPADQGVYVIGAEDHPIKIGIAKNIRHRLSGIQTGCPVPLQVYCFLAAPEGLAREVERACHDKLLNYRLSGEWFDVSPERAIEVVREHLDQYKARNRAA